MTDFEWAYNRIKTTSIFVDSNDTCEVYKTDNHIITYVDLKARSFLSFDISDDGRQMKLFGEVVN